jgi:hypothetical protein
VVYERVLENYGTLTVVLLPSHTTPSITVAFIHMMVSLILWQIHFLQQKLISLHSRGIAVLAVLAV